jgi:hypothetical protein
MCLVEGERKSGPTRHPKRHHMYVYIYDTKVPTSNTCIIYHTRTVEQDLRVVLDGIARLKKTKIKLQKNDLQGVLDGVACLMTGLGRRTARTIDTFVWQDLGSAHRVKPPYARNRLLQHVRVSELGDKAQPRACKKESQMSPGLICCEARDTEREGSQQPATEHAKHE